jgi:hypothetical protein
MAFANLSILFALSTTISLPMILALMIPGFVSLKGRTMTFVDTSRLLPALAAALPEHPGIETLKEMEVVVWELLAQLVAIAGRIGIGLGQSLLPELGDPGSSEEGFLNGKATQEDADQSMEFENGDNKS